MSIPRFILQGVNALEQCHGKNELSDIVSTLLTEQGIGLGNWQPMIDVVDTDEELKVFVDLPGVDRASINVEFFNNQIMISGERECPYVCKALKKELSYGSFSRKITVPMSITRKDGITKEFKDGVLVLTIDKSVEKENKFNMRMDED